MEGWEWGRSGGVEWPGMMMMRGWKRGRWNVASRIEPQMCRKCVDNPVSDCKKSLFLYLSIPKKFPRVLLLSYGPIWKAPAASERSCSSSSSLSQVGFNPITQRMEMKWSDRWKNTKSLLKTKHIWSLSPAGFFVPPPPFF